MAIYKSKRFARDASRSGIDDRELCGAAHAVIAGSVDADLGGGVIKQRLARTGAGKSGGYRAIVLFRSGTHLFFVHVFAKSKQDNITRSELSAFRKAADVILRYSDSAIDVAEGAGELIEVHCNES